MTAVEGIGGNSVPERGPAILEAVDASPASPSEMGRQTELPLSTLHRLALARTELEFPRPDCTQWIAERTRSVGAPVIIGTALVGAARQTVPLARVMGATRRGPRRGDCPGGRPPGRRPGDTPPSLSLDARWCTVSMHRALPLPAFAPPARFASMAPDGPDRELAAARWE